MNFKRLLILVGLINLYNFQEIYLQEIYKEFDYEFVFLPKVQDQVVVSVKVLKFVTYIHFQRRDLSRGASSKSPCLLIFLKTYLVGLSQIVCMTF